MDAPRIAPLARDHWSPDAADALGKMLAGADGEPINIFATLANHPKMLKRWLVFAAHVLSKSTLPARDRELLILRTGWRCRAPYEWGQHVAIARRCGITDDEIAAVGSGPDHDTWTTHEAALLRAADELRDDAYISDPTWAVLASSYSTEQMLDVIAAVGNYTLVSYLLNSCRVALDPGVDAGALANAR
jgi:4-carboxymuconolactone decarboxylase